MKRFLCVFFVFMILLVGCKKGGENIVTEKYVQANNLVTKNVNVSEFGALNLPYRLQGSRSMAFNMDFVKDMVGLECLRTNDKVSYSVHKVSFANDIEGYAFISYNSEAVIDTWFVVKIPSKSEFENIKVNKTTLEQIKQLDPATIVYDSDEPVSYHRFSDGTMMEIYYKNNGDKLVVKEYGISEDPANIVENLLPIDLELVN